MARKFPLVVTGVIATATGASAQVGGGNDLTWSTMDNGGGVVAAGDLEMIGTIGQGDTGTASAGPLEMTGGFIVAFADEPAACYANCDGSSESPILNIADFTCFLFRFASGDPWANCDGSSQEPTLNFADFSCYLFKYASGCP